MNLQWLYYFNAIAEVEHYTRAAEKLHVSQSNLSHAIKELEAELGAELFERRGRNIRLTRYGELFRPYAEKTINTLETGVKTLREYIDPNVGTIVMAGFQSVSQFVVDLMVRYQSETNRMEVQFQYSSEVWTRVQRMLLDGSTDLVLATRIDDPHVDGVFVGTHRLTVLVPEDHRLAGQESVDLRELNGEDFIAFDNTSEIRGQLNEIFGEMDIHPDIAVETPNDLVIYGLVAAGRGLSIVPYPLTGAPYRTRILPISNDIPPRRLYLQWNKERYIPPAAEFFRDYVIRSADVFDQYLRFHNI